MNAAPLKYNAEKIDMAKGLLASGLQKLAASQIQDADTGPAVNLRGPLVRALAAKEIV